MKRISPKEAGIYPAAVSDFLDEIEREGLNLHKFMMLRHGNIFAEGSYRPYREEELHTLFSFSKSFTSTAVGFAVQDGLLSLEDHVVDFFPDQDPDKLGERMKRMKVFHLLTMNTGHTDPMDWMFDRTDLDWCRCFLESEPEKEPGSFFLYNNRATYMLSAIVCKVTGRSMFNYLKEKLFDPLDFRRDIWWETSPQGYEGGAYGLNLSLEDMAKFGIFLMNQGCYEGKQLLNAKWFQDAVKPWSDTSGRWGGEYEYGYGYQFWMCSVPGIYRADGAFGQFCVIAPEYDLILVTNSAEPDLGRILEAFWHHILPAADKKQTITEEWDLMQNVLEKRISDLEVNTSWKNGSLSETNRHYSGNLDGGEYILEDNMYGLQSISFMKSGNDCRISLKNGKNTDSFIVSAAQWNDAVLHPDLPEREIKKLTFRMGLYENASVKGYFEKDTVHFDMIFRETPYRDTWRISSAENEIEISIKRNVGNKPVDFTVRGNKTDLLYELTDRMIAFYQGDPKRIQHFLKVHSFARLIGTGEQLDKKTLFILETAALTHDIGIKPSEEKYGSCNGKLQEQEGPAPAREMLTSLGFESDVIDRVCFLIAHHHTYDQVDYIDYQILLEADALVNLFEDQVPFENIKITLEKIFQTKTGIQICKKMFLQT